MNIATYWYLASFALPASHSLFESDVLPGPLELLRRLGLAQGVVLAKWDEQALLGRVSALGVCVERMPEAAKIDWREINITLKPNPAGRVHWRTKPCFGFADSVVDRYGLADLFGERFPDLGTLTFTARSPLPKVPRRPPLVAKPGYVYLVRSPYGIKIGKTVNIRSRTRLYQVEDQAVPGEATIPHQRGALCLVRQLLRSRALSA